MNYTRHRLYAFYSIGFILFILLTLTIISNLFTAPWPVWWEASPWPLTIKPPLPHQPPPASSNIVTPIPAAWHPGDTNPWPWEATARAPITRDIHPARPLIPTLTHTHTQPIRWTDSIILTELTLRVIRLFIYFVSRASNSNKCCSCYWHKTRICYSYLGKLTSRLRKVKFYGRKF